MTLDLVPHATYTFFKHKMVKPALARKQRLALLERVLKQGAPVAKACREFGVSRFTFYKWAKKYQLKATRSQNLKNLADKKRRIEKFPRQASRRVEEEVKKIVAENPEFSKYKIALKLKGRLKEKAVGVHGVYNILKRAALTTKDARKEWRQFVLETKKRVLSPEQRLVVIKRAVELNMPVAQVCRDFGISRYTFYKWKKRWEKAGRQIDALRDRKPQFDRRHLRVKPDLESVILTIVIDAPNLSKYGIARKISEKLGPVVSPHGVYNVLLRKGLNRPEARLAYSSAHAPEVPTPVSWTDRLRTVLEQFVPTFAPAPPPGLSSILNFLRVFSLSSILSSATFYSLLWWINYITSQVTQVSVGLVFASIALFMGSLFFLYSLKYYITLAIVLSFSQKEQRTGYREQDEGKGLTSWLLGFANGDVKPRQVGTTSRAVGLEPNLEHITLKRYPKVSVHIPLYNEKNVVERLIAAVTNFDYKGDYEVILADDSTDETTQIIQDYILKSSKQNVVSSKGKNKSHATYSKLHTTKGKGWTLTQAEVRPGVVLKHLHRTSRFGFKGGALKLALRVTDPKAEFVSVFDADFVPYPDTLELFLKYFQATAGTLDFKKGSRVQGLGSSGNSSKPHTLQPKASPIAAVQGYQWHVLNKSENWITRGVRSEYAGSYVIERSGTEIYSGLKQISGAVYMIRRDVLEEIGWETSITEDFQLTLKLYEKGYKIVYTPYIQAPAECVSTLKRLIRQRMRWAEGHSNNIRRMFWRLLVGRWENIPSSGSNVGKFLSSNLAETSSAYYSNYSKEIPKPKSQLGQLEIRSIRNSQENVVFVPSPLTLSEKLEFLYVSPYYLQAFFFLVGTVSWLISETVFQAGLPFWTSLWGWSLVFTNLLSLPLMNSVGLFLEESEERDYAGIFSFILLSYIVVPFQAYAAVKGFIQKEEGPWFRTPKTGRITDVFARGRFYRFISGILPGRSQPEPSVPKGAKAYLSLVSANNKFDSFSLKPKKARWIGKAAFALSLSIAIFLVSLAPFINSQPELPKETPGLQIPVLSAQRSTFSLDEAPEFILDLGNDGILDQRASLIKEAKATKANDIETVVLFRDTPIKLPVEVSPLPNGKLAINLQPIDNLEPGKYTLQIFIGGEGEQRVISSQEFTWGVLAINTNKPVYKPFEQAHIALAVLDNKGYMVCDSELTLTITNSVLGIKDTLTTDDGGIWVNPECKTKDLVTKPDYETVYQVNAEGDYTMHLVAETKDGKRSFYDSFEVRESIEFEIERFAATRIYPVRRYPVRILVIPQKDYQGKVVETVPSSFEIMPGDYLVGERSIVWEVDWKAGKTYELTYTYDAPNDSPEFYSLGPLAFENFKESRLWHIAVDANTAGNYMIRRNNAETSSVPNAGSNLDDGWDTEVETKGSSITYSDPTFTLASGKYLVLWSERFDTADTTNNERIEVQARLRVAGSEVIPGAGSCYIRKSSGQQECTAQGAAILNIASDSTALDTRWFRGDNSTTGTVDRFPDWGGIAILALDDTWDYARYSTNTDRDVPDAFADVTWDVNDEQDATFTRTGANIDIATAGRYLATLSIDINAPSGGRFEEVGRLELNGTEIVGTYASVYIRDIDSNEDGIYSWVGIIDVAAGDDLTLGMDNIDGGTASLNDIESGSTIEILQLPSGNETMILHATTGDWNTSAVTEFAMDTQPHLDAAAFTYTNGNSFFDVDIDDDYLFFTSMWTNNGGARTFGTGRWSVNDVVQEHWAAGRYGRSSGADQPGYGGGTLVTGLNATDDISLETLALGATTAQNCISTAGCSISALRLGSVVDQDLDQQHYRWRNDDGSESAATFSHAEDAVYTDYPRETVTRLRFLVSNDGIDTAANTYQLQVNQTATCTDAGYTAVPTDSSGHWQIIGSGNITDGEATTNVSVGGGLTDPTAGTFTAGEAKDTGNTTGSITVEGSGGGQFTEIEFVLQATTNSLDNTNYCFRLNNVDTYTVYAEAVVVPEYTWLFFGLGPLLPLIGRIRKKK